MITVVQPGPLATVQDMGRFGHGHHGVGRSGAADRFALGQANLLVGNFVDDAAIEVTFGGLELLLEDAATIAVTGARCGGFDWGRPVTLFAGTRVVLEPPARGLRSYVAVRGGITVPAVLGSRSTDTLSGLGPAPLRAGDRLPVGDEPFADVSMVDAVPRPTPERLRVVLGPRADWFTAESVARFTATSWQVRSDSNRIGLRLDGEGLVRARAGELLSEPTLPGAIQVPPDGRPILLGPDAPVTGGYPVIAVVVDADLDAAAQFRPGDPVRFAVA